MNIQFLKANLETTPAFVVDADEVVKTLSRLDGLRHACGCKVLYSIKALPLSTILELANRIKSLTDSTSKTIFNPLPVDDPKVRMPDISKAKKIIKWEPKVDLEDGLTRTISWFKDNL